MDSENELRSKLAQLYEANRALVAGEVDAVVPEDAGAPVLLRRAQEALQSSERLFRAMFTEALDGIVITDDESRYVDANPAACRLFGRTREEILGHSAEEFTDGGFDVQQAWNLSAEAGGQTGQFRLVRPDGTIRDTEYSARANFLPGLHLAFLRDVTDIARAERELRASEERFRGIVETAAEGVWLLDGGDLTSYVNTRLATLLGYGAQEMLGRHVHEFVGPESRATVDARLAKQRQGAGEPFDVTLRRKDGGLVHAFVSTSSVLGSGGAYRGVLAMVTDMTERRELEEQLRQSQKMDGIGRFAGGIAHDFNNVLAVIMGYADGALRRVNDPDSVRSRVEAIQKAAERAAALTHQILTFSRKQVLQPKVIDVAGLLRELEGMLRRMIGEDIELAVGAEAGVGRICADPSQIEQVILNLAANARDAMPGGGRLTIHLRNADVDEHQAAEHVGLPAGPYVVLLVRDTGVGMPPEVQSRIFEPFFTTKEEGKGTGLGLATVYGIVKQSGGHVAVESAVGAGTTFVIHLPRVPTASATAHKGVPADTAARGTETVLLVEDEEILRYVAAEALASFGYKVVVAPSPSEAIELHGQMRDDRPAVLVTDLVMPGMNGHELAERLIDAQPDLRVLLISGYASDSISRAQGHERRWPFLRKPFTPSALARSIREVLAAPR